MYKFIALLVGVLLLLPTAAQAARYGERLCGSQHFYCIKVQKGQSWQSLWPNAQQRDLVKRLNRMNIALRPGMTVAVPKNIHWLDHRDISPFADRIAAQGRKTIIVVPAALAWGAYNKNGKLVHWGPMSGGQGWCSDVKRSCRTVTGTFTVYRKQGSGCVSTKYPLGRGGAPMPYCMFFHRGYAFHGSPQVPGYHASHGCVRVFTEDARWLNQEFVTSGSTRVIVLPYRAT